MILLIGSVRRVTLQIVLGFPLFILNYRRSLYIIKYVLLFYNYCIFFLFLHYDGIYEL